MTPFLSSGSLVESKDHCNTPEHLVANLPSIKYVVFIIIGISFLLRALWIGHNSLLVEEAYYWNYAQHLDFGYLDHPPMVGLLIKLTTSLFGTNEFGVRIASLLCWLLTAFFSFKLTNLIARGAGLYAVMLLSILPFFFLHSLVITPDQPLTACWSATLYCLYRSLILDESNYWYTAGIFLGLGLLSKYTIALLGPATLLYLFLVPTARQWFTRKEPYICAFIAALLFTPVIYWNATHEWASFWFQSTRRLEAKYSFSLHHLIGLLIFFVMPGGIWSLGLLFKKNSTVIPSIEIKTKRFLQIFTIVPLIVFGVFSLTHAIKFNWIGPGLLALIPWLAMLIKQTPKTKLNILHSPTSWVITGVFFLICYSSVTLIICFGAPEVAYSKLFIKFIDWEDVTQQVYRIAHETEVRTNKAPIIVPLDVYNIGSELSFYQAKFLVQGDIPKSYPIIGRQIFGADSLMYRYWAPKDNLAGRTLILISSDHHDFTNNILQKMVITDAKVGVFWAHSQQYGARVNQYYYQVVQMKP